MASARTNAQEAQRLAGLAKLAANTEHERLMAESVGKLAEAVSEIGFKLHHMS